MDLSLVELPNFCQITERIGTSGQPTRAQFHAIAAAGYASVINLAMHDSDDAIPKEGSIVASLGMNYLHLPVPFDAPGRAHLQRFCRMMDALEPERVFVHCQVNARVSAFMYQYLTLTKGVSAAQATSPLLRKWLPTMNPEWRAIMALTREDL